MCLTTSIGITPMTAEKPILVFKELLIAKVTPSFPAFWENKWSYRTPFQGFDIKFSHGKCEMGDGIMTGLVLFEIMDERCVHASKYDVCWDDEGIHPVCTGTDDEFPEDNVLSTTAYVYKGIHANLKIPAVSYPYVVNLAIIPEGAHYFIGDDGDIVADRMIIYDDEKQLRKDYDYGNLHRFDA